MKERHTMWSGGGCRTARDFPVSVNESDSSLVSNIHLATGRRNHGKTWKAWARPKLKPHFTRIQKYTLFLCPFVPVILKFVSETPSYQHQKLVKHGETPSEVRRLGCSLARDARVLDTLLEVLWGPACFLLFARTD